MKRKSIASLILTIPLILTLLCACSADKKEEVGERGESNSFSDFFETPEIPDAVEENSPLASSVPAVSAAASVDRIEISDFSAEGSFSEGLAYITYNIGSALHRGYIDKQGTVVFNLPAGFLKGYPFHDGFAVVVKESGYNEGQFEDGYAIIDRTGKIILEDPEYTYISRASDGRFCAIRTTVSYAGTTSRCEFLDYDGNVVATVDGECSPGRFFQYGTISVKNRFYDKNGKLVKDFSDDIRPGYNVFDCQSKDDCSYVTITRLGSNHEGEVFDRKSLEIISTGHTVLNYGSDCGVSNNCYSARRDDGKFIVRDKNGKETRYDIAGLSSIKSQDVRDDDIWIAELQNGYYSLVDKSGKFVIEPVQEHIYYLGESKYYLSSSKKVINSAGKVLFTAEDEPLRNVMGNEDMFSEGMILTSGQKYLSDTGAYLDRIYINT